ncbi:MAG: asparagine synthase-related protein [Candidatus Thorarchaeota archaeon]
MKIDRDGLELLMHAGGEMFSKTVFEHKNYEPKIIWPEDRTVSDGKELGKEELDKLDHLLQEAARKSLAKAQGKKIGFTLSGGVDSSLLLFLIRKVYPTADITAYHTDWKWAPRSELKFAEMAATLANVPLKVIDVSPEAQIPHIDEALSAMKTVSYSTVPTYMAFKRMVADGADVTINALGLDELFAGYTIHRRMYQRSRIHFIPKIGSLLGWKYYRGAVLKWGADSVWLYAATMPTYASQFVLESDVDFQDIYDNHVLGKDIWTSIHNYILWAMISNYATYISRAADANGVECLYPWMDHELMDYTLNYGPHEKYNKKPIRFLMREYYKFPDELAARGENWDKLGWGGTALPYFDSKKYMEHIMPSTDVSSDWFTQTGLKEYKNLGSKPSIRGLHMAIFLKTLELI